MSRRIRNQRGLSEVLTGIVWSCKESQLAGPMSLEAAKGGLNHD